MVHSVDVSNTTPWRQNLRTRVHGCVQGAWAHLMPSLLSLVLCTIPGLPSFDDLLANRRCRLHSANGLVDCIDADIDAVPRGIPNGTTKLWLGRNNITFLTSGDFTGLPLLTELDISENQINRLDPGSFRELPTLKKLKLPDGNTPIATGMMALTELPGDAVVLGASPYGDSRTEAAPEERSHCPHDRSRWVQKVVQRWFVPALEPSAPGPEAASSGATQKIEVSHRCPLNQVFDMYARHHAKTIEINRNKFKCGYCGKAFRAEHYLDSHMDARHADLIPAHATVCPNDYCGMFWCDCTIGCTPAAVADSKEECRKVVAACVLEPDRQELETRLCDSLSCDIVEAICQVDTAPPSWMLLICTSLVIVLIAALTFIYFCD